MNQHHDAIISLVASLAPDRGVPVGRHTELVDDLGYDSPRKMELVASIEKHLQIAVPPPQHPIDTVDDLLRWIDTISTPRQASHESASTQAGGATKPSSSREAPRESVWR